MILEGERCQFSASCWIYPQLLLNPNLIPMYPCTGQHLSTTFILLSAPKLSLSPGQLTTAMLTLTVYLPFAVECVYGQYHVELVPAKMLLLLLFCYNIYWFPFLLKCCYCINITRFLFLWTTFCLNFVCTMNMMGANVIGRHLCIHYL